MGPAALPSPEASGGRELGQRPQSLIKCLLVSCGASVWDGNTGNLGQTDTCDLLPLPKPYWTPLSWRLRSHQTPNPVLPGDPRTRAIMSLPAATPASPKPEHLGGAGRDLCLSPCDILIALTLIALPPCVCVCASWNPFLWVSACPVPSQLLVCLVHLFLAFFKLSRLKTPFLLPLLLGESQCGGSGLWCVHVCIYVFVTPWGMSPVFCCLVPKMLMAKEATGTQVGYGVG